MTSLIEYLDALHPAGRVLSIVLLALGAHGLVRLLRAAGELVGVSRLDHNLFHRRFPRTATLLTMLVSAAAFTIYFIAIGLLMREFGLSLKSYVASATVIGLAIGFGSQGLVQDIVIGLTLIFSDVLNVGDMVDISGQTGRVDEIGLRFTTLVNLVEQRVYVPNRNINQINRYRNGYVRAYADIQLPAGADADALGARIAAVGAGMRSQFPAILLTDPAPMGIHDAGEGAWSFLRVKFRVWPGQGALIETTFKQRVLATMRTVEPAYADWMVTVTYRAE